MKNTLVVNDIKEEEEKFHKAVEILRKGGLVVFPTETVYGLGANAFDDEAVKRIFIVKERPPDNPLIVHIYSINDLTSVAEEIHPLALELFTRFSPGPLTIILKKSKNISNFVTSGLETVAIRIPSHPVARLILKESKLPIAAPSANLSGRPSPTTFEMALKEMDGKVDAIINGGMCEVGLESTVIKIEENSLKILRPGIISEEMIKETLPPHMRIEYVSNKNKIESPGLKYTHYKPEADVFLCEASEIESVSKQFDNETTGYIVYKGKTGENVRNVVRVSSLEEYAKRLYSIFYEFEKNNLKRIIAEKVEEKGIGKAIMNRLKKASGNKKIYIP